MIPFLFFILTPLCVLHGGDGQYDCSYQWTQIFDREEFESLYLEYGGKEDPTTVGAFTVLSERKVFFHDTSMEALIHELKHVECNLQFYEDLDITKMFYCHFLLDLKDNHRPEETAPTPPPISQKLQFTQQNFMFG